MQSSSQNVTRPGRINLSLENRFFCHLRVDSPKNHFFRFALLAFFWLLFFDFLVVGRGRLLKVWLNKKVASSPS
jgi:hypothetical protein